MSAVEEYDLVVLGSGAPGKLLAWTLASQGKRVAVVAVRAGRVTLRAPERQVGQDPDINPASKWISPSTHLVVFGTALIVTGSLAVSCLAG